MTVKYNIESDIETNKCMYAYIWLSYTLYISKQHLNFYHDLFVNSLAIC